MTTDTEHKLNRIIASARAVLPYLHDVETQWAVEDLRRYAENMDKPWGPVLLPPLGEDGERREPTLPQ